MGERCGDSETWSVEGALRKQAFPLSPYSCRQTAHLNRSLYRDSDENIPHPERRNLKKPFWRTVDFLGRMAL